MTYDLTAQEAEAISRAGELYTLLEEIVGTSDTREADLQELRGPIHVIQRAVMAQAIARHQPERYRVLGGLVTRVPATEAGGER